MSRAYWKWSAAIGLVIIISAAVVWWPRKTQEGDSSALTNTWRDGDPMALNSLSGFYKQQYESGADPAGLTKSFAYWLAFRELYHASRQAAGPDMKPFFGGIEITTNRVQENLLPAQIAEAESLAKDILRNRPTNCCISLDVPR